MKKLKNTWCDYYRWVETEVKDFWIELVCAYFEIPKDEEIAKFRIGVGEEPTRFIDILVE